MQGTKQVSLGSLLLFLRNAEWLEWKNRVHISHLTARTRSSGVYETTAFCVNLFFTRLNDRGRWQYHREVSVWSTSHCSYGTACTKSLIPISKKFSHPTRKSAAQLDMSRLTVRRILRNDLGLEAYKRPKVHGLSTAQKANRLIRCKGLLRRFATDHL